MNLYLEYDNEVRDFYQEALETYGLPSQIGLVTEECAELIVALNHVVRGKATIDDVAGEIADVMVMLGQLMHMCDFETVESIAEQKLRRAETRIKTYKANGGRPYVDGYTRYLESK